MRTPSPNKIALYLERRASPKNPTDTYQRKYLFMFDDFCLSKYNKKKKPLFSNINIIIGSGKEIVKKTFITGIERSNSKNLR